MARRQVIGEKTDVARQKEGRGSRLRLGKRDHGTFLQLCQKQQPRRGGCEANGGAVEVGDVSYTRSGAT